MVCHLSQGLKDEAKKVPTRGAHSRNWKRVRHDQSKEFLVKMRLPNWPLAYSCPSYKFHILGSFSLLFIVLSKYAGIRQTPGNFSPVQGHKAVKEQQHPTQKHPKRGEG